MKKLLLVVVLLFVQNIFALDSISSVPDDQKKVINRIVEVPGFTSLRNNPKTIDYKYI